MTKYFLIVLVALLAACGGGDIPPASAAQGIYAKSTWVGRWFQDSKSGKSVVTSIRQGSSFTSMVTGATKLIAEIAVPASQQYAPIVAVYVDNQTVPSYVTVGTNGVNGGGDGGKTILVSLATGLSASTHKVTVFISGLDPEGGGGAAAANGAAA